MGSPRTFLAAFIALVLALAPCTQALAKVAKANAANPPVTALGADAAFSDTGKIDAVDTGTVLSQCNKACGCRNQKAITASSIVLVPRTPKALLIHGQAISPAKAAHEIVRVMQPTVVPEFIGPPPTFKAALARTGRLLI